MRITWVPGATMVLLTALRLDAQQAPQAPAPKPAEKPAAPAPARQRRPEEPQFDEEAVKRGQELLVARCGFCHGSNARGGSSGPDLTRSSMVQEDENGKQLGDFLRVGRPERNMPKFELSPQELTDLATFLHSTIYQIGNRGSYQILDLKGVGAKYEPATLQGRMLLPRGGRRRGGPPGERVFTPPYTEANAVKATVTLPTGASFDGALVRLTDFDVMIYDPETRQMRSWLRKDGIPKVVLTDPLQAHVDLWRKWSDPDMQNVTAYLASLKQ